MAYGPSLFHLQFHHRNGTSLNTNYKTRGSNLHRVEPQPIHFGLVARYHRKKTLWVEHNYNSQSIERSFRCFFSSYPKESRAEITVLQSPLKKPTECFCWDLLQNCDSFPTYFGHRVPAHCWPFLGSRLRPWQSNCWGIRCILEHL